ncbi:MAG TPA: glycerophosphodiester phosphodiesterase family protein [Solirubrobacteraceae bacterium]|nr:glycerophosphodiester phosphodiesterase family protein [Solirubrobacteraceae bacterium]
MPALADLSRSWLARAPIAHRGLHDLAAGRPENSLAAFARCCETGFAAELDVRLSRDGEVVVFHDRAVRRLTGAAGRVEDLTGAQLTALEIHGTGERIPLLREVLALVAGRVPLLVELKRCARGPALERAVLRALGGYRGAVAIQSFKRRSVKHLDRAEAPHAVGHLWRRVHVHGAQVRPAFYGCHVAVAGSAAVRRRRAAGAIVLAWTVRSPEEARWALRHVDNYIFEGFVPDLVEHRLSALRSAAAASR